MLEPEDDDWEDDLVPHGGLWSRPIGEDALRCAEHWSTVGERSRLDQIELDLSVQPDRWTFPCDRCRTEHTERPPFVALRAASGPPSS